LDPASPRPLDRRAPARDGRAPYHPGPITTAVGRRAVGPCRWSWRLLRRRWNGAHPVPWVKTAVPPVGSIAFFVLGNCLRLWRYNRQEIPPAPRRTPNKPRRGPGCGTTKWGGWGPLRGGFSSEGLSWGGGCPIAAGNAVRGLFGGRSRIAERGISGRGMSIGSVLMKPISPRLRG